jgi:hypothetical protein
VSSLLPSLAIHCHRSAAEMKIKEIVFIHFTFTLLTLCFFSAAYCSSFSDDSPETARPLLRCLRCASSAPETKEMNKKIVKISLLLKLTILPNLDRLLMFFLLLPCL